MKALRFVLVFLAFFLSLLVFNSGVFASTLQSISISPGSFGTPVGTTRNFYATGHYSDGSTQSLTSTATWSSSNSAIATVSGGVASALAQGSVTLTASSGSISGTATFTVLPPAVMSISITPSSASMQVGGSQTFTATGKYTDGSTQDLTGGATWTSSNTVVATVSGGTATGVGSGTVTITAASGSISGRATLTVTPALSSISVSPGTASVGQGGTQAFTATGHYSDASSQNLTSSVSWSSSNTTFATISSGGVAGGVSPGSVTITAASGSLSGSASLTVTAPTLTSITVAPGTYSGPVGTSQTFIAIGHYTDGSSPTLSSVSWSSSNNAVATINSIGVATGVAAGTVTITATSGTITGTGTFTVTGGTKTLTSISVSPGTASIAVNGTQGFTATGQYSDGSSQNLTSSVTWSSSNMAFATINGSGVASGVAAGTVTVTAVLGSISGTAMLTVGGTPPTLTSISISPASASVGTGGTQAFTATGHYSDGSSQNLTTTVSWSSSNTGYATISSGGVASGVAPGSVTITAVSGSNSTTATLSVTTAVLQSISISPGSFGAPAGTTRNFYATGHYSDGSTQSLTSTATWSSSNSAIATVSGGVASALAQGSVTLTASSGSISGTATFTVLPPAVMSISITPSSASMLVGGNQTFTATGKYTDGSTQNLTGTATWTSSNMAVATISGGTATGVATGSTTITAASGSISGRATLTVTPALSSISVSPSTASVGQGGTQAFTATGHYSDASSQNLTSSVSWSSSNTTFATISSGGVAGGVSPGSVTITAASGSLSGSAALTVTAPTLTSITVAPGTYSGPVGTSQTFIAIGHYTDGSSPTLSSVSWSSSNNAVATINSSGVATGVAAGTVTITATSGTITGTGTFTVTGGTKTLTSISVSPGTASIAVNGTQGFTATGQYSDGSSQNLTSSVTWSSSNMAFATINGSGVASGVAAGTVTVTAVLGSISGTAMLTVGGTPPTLTSISISPASASVGTGGTQAFTATGHYSDGSSQNLTTTVSWSSSNTGYATISSGGVASGVAPGSVTITAVSGSNSTTATLSVTTAVLQSISISPGSFGAPAGTTRNFYATGHYSDGSTQSLTSTATWSSSNSAIATVSGGVASALAQGSVTLTASSGSISGTATFTVLPPAVMSISITPSSASMLVGGNQTFTATGKYTDGSTQNLTGTATWTSSNMAVATISGGTATGVATGSTTITAASGSISGRATLTVTPALSSISVSPSTASVGQGGTQAFTATGHYSDGSSQNLTSSVSWSSSNTAFATISSGGVAGGVSPGSVTITAASGSLSGSAALTVTAPTLTSITVSPGTFSLSIGTTQTFIAIGHYTDGSSPTLSSVTWTSSNSAVATINSNGVATAVAAGTVTITATLGSVTGTGTLTGLGQGNLTSLTVSPSTITISLGLNQAFVATGHYSDGSSSTITNAVTWSSSNSAVATISGNGIASGANPGSVTITATSGSVSGTAALTVSNTPTLTSITVSPGSFSIPQGTTETFSAIGHYSDGTSQDISTTLTWTSSNTSVSTVSSNGMATGIGPGSAIISAASGSVTGTSSLTVTTGFSITPRAAVLTLSETQQFSANGSVTWSIDGVPGGNATVGTISSSGLYMPPATIGSHTVTGIGILNPMMTGTSTVYVTNSSGVFTYHNDNGRTGQNLNETVLTPQNVNSNQFGKLFSYPVDGNVYAQPLYVPNVNIPAQGTHNVLFVATENDSVYAFDADGLNTAPLWQTSFISPAGCNPANCVTPVPQADVIDSAITPIIGITSTPVIDPTSNTLYVVAYTKETSNNVATYVFRLHALDITTGAEKFGGPVVIQGSVPGTGVYTSNGIVPFSPTIAHHQRAALLLLNGVVYIGFASHGDAIAWHGWVMGYNAQTLAQTGIYNTTPNAVAGGIWQSGGGLAGDASGNIYFSTGNGTFDGDIGGVDLGTSIIKLSTSGGLSLSDWFTPYNQAYLTQNDQDLGSGGVMLLPDQAGSYPHLLVGAGKQGSIYLLNRDNMGHYNSTADTSVQTLTKALGDAYMDDGMFSTPAYWQNAAGQEYLYFHGHPDYVKAFQFSNGLLSTAPVSQSKFRYLFPASVPVVSATGGVNGILWSVQTDSYGTGGPAILRAYDANNLATEFYDSTQAGTRDVAGAAIKFCVPTVVNGRVYIGGQSQVTIYGLLP